MPQLEQGLSIYSSVAPMIHHRRHSKGDCSTQHTQENWAAYHTNMRTSPKRKSPVVAFLLGCLCSASILLVALIHYRGYSGLNNSATVITIPVLKNAHTEANNMVESILGSNSPQKAPAGSHVDDGSSAGKMAQTEVNDALPPNTRTEPNKSSSSVSSNALAQWVRETQWAKRESVKSDAIVICSVCVGNAYSAPKWALVQENHRRYAEKHGYLFVSPQNNEEFLKIAGDNSSDHVLQLGNMYLRLPLLRKLLNSGLDGKPVQWAFYSDCDTVFTNLDVKMQSFMHPTKSFILSGDGIAGGPKFTINSGHILMRNTAFARELLNNITTMRMIFFEDRELWDRVTMEWKAKAGRDFMHDQSLFDAMLGGANPSDPSTWHASARKNLGYYATIADCKASMERLPPYMQKHVEYLPSFVLNSNPWTFYRGAFKLHATALACDGPEKKVDFKLDVLLKAIEGNYTNPCKKFK